MKRIIYIFFILIFHLLTLSCAEGQIKNYTLEVVKEYPHDRSAYTQGLFIHEGQLYESTGLRGQSMFRVVDLETGEASRTLHFDDKYFVEGSVIFNDNLYILTWETRLAFIYDAKTLEFKRTVTYPRQGWGLTHDGKQLIASDGSSYLYFLDDNLKLKSKVQVKRDGRIQTHLNELEYINGKIWANVYLKDEILIIDPKSGVVEGVIDCRGLLKKSLKRRDTDVLNGIAYDAENDKIYITGKNWPLLYEIKIVSL